MKYCASILTALLLPAPSCVAADYAWAGLGVQTAERIKATSWTRPKQIAKTEKARIEKGSKEEFHGDFKGKTSGRAE
jgi:hypothetical protein